MRTYTAALLLFREYERLLGVRRPGAALARGYLTRRSE